MQHKSPMNNIPIIDNTSFIQKILNKNDGDSENNSIDYNRSENDVKLPTING